MRMTIQRLDWFLAIPLIAGVVMVAEIDGPREVVRELTQFEQGAILIPITLLLGVIIAAASAIDRRCSEEYTFQVMANAALTALATTMMVNLFWLIGVKTLDLPDLSGENMAGIMVIAWVLSYYWFRMRGIAR